MKSRVIFCFDVLVVILLLSSFSLNKSDDKGEDCWNLIWEENFSHEALDPTVWGYMKRGRDQSRKFHSPFPDCYDFNDSCIVIKGIKNNSNLTDTATYLTGAITTKSRKEFIPPCRIEIRAKINSAQGAWPAIWLLPFKNENGWPMDGEIDIAEHLNYDDFVYQSVHSSYTKANPNGKPKRSVKAGFNKDAFNVFGVDIHEDRIEFYVNGKRTLTYPKINSVSAENQFPFNRGWYLMFDMQLGGSWVGDIDPHDIPVEMQIDWIKYYKPKTLK